jgi:ornithine cyclodeaminase/alanine dehydrogenase-like protein (mu-crystallin family)
MKTLYLTESDVTQLLTMPDAIRAVEEAFRASARGEAINRPRQRVRVPDGVLHVMPGSASRYLGFKYYSSFRPKTRFWVHLMDATNGDLLCVMQADRLGQQRTGAASGVATRYLAREDASTVGLIGTGWQAESQLQAVCAVRAVGAVRCYSRDPDGRKTFAKKMREMLDVDVRAADSAEETIRGAEIIITATNSREPVLRGEWIAAGSHINAVGSNRVESRELDDDAVNRCAFICVDSLDQAKIESGDLISPIRNRLFDWDRVHELGDVVAGKIQGRKKRDDVTCFKSNGVAIEDVAAAAMVYKRAIERKIGREIEL